MSAQEEPLEPVSVSMLSFAVVFRAFSQYLAPPKPRMPKPSLANLPVPREPEPHSGAEPDDEPESYDNESVTPIVLPPSLLSHFPLALVRTCSLCLSQTPVRGR